MHTNCNTVAIADRPATGAPTFSLRECVDCTVGMREIINVVTLLGQKRLPDSLVLTVFYALVKPVVVERFGWGRRAWRQRQQAEREAVGALGIREIGLRDPPRRELEEFCCSSAGYDRVYQRLLELLRGQR